MKVLFLDESFVPQLIMHMKKVALRQKSKFSYSNFTKKIMRSDIIRVNIRPK